MPTSVWESFVKIRTLGVRIHPDSGENLITLSGKQQPTHPSGHLATVIGDAVHNLRTALDYVASEIYRAGGQDPKSAVFPIDRDKASLIRQPKFKFIAEIAPVIAALIVDVMGPHCEDYVALNHLDRDDKHRLLITSLAKARAEVLCIEDENDVTRFEAGAFLVLPQGKAVSSGSPADRHNQDNCKALFEFQFQEGYACGGQPVIATLNRLADRVAQLVEVVAAQMARSSIYSIRCKISFCTSDVPS